GGGTALPCSFFQLEFLLVLPIWVGFGSTGTTSAATVVVGL
ncbi:hypothetical protein A2U01_0090229, partial [Trifolium medium]|nr:hypothetical protein [Trifolium medium]